MSQRLTRLVTRNFRTNSCQFYRSFFILFLLILSSSLFFLPSLRSIAHFIFLLLFFFLPSSYFFLSLFPLFFLPSERKRSREPCNEKHEQLWPRTKANLQDRGVIIGKFLTGHAPPKSLWCGLLAGQRAKLAVVNASSIFLKNAHAGSEAVEKNRRQWGVIPPTKITVWMKQKLLKPEITWPLEAELFSYTRHQSVFKI